MSPKTKKLLLVLPVLIAVTALLMFLRSNDLLTGYSAETIRDWVEQYTPWSEAVFFGLQLMSVIIAPIPSNVTAAAGGLLFGFPKGFLLTIAAVVLGSCTTFSLARLWGQSFAQGFVSKKLSARYLNLIQRKRDVFLVLVFLFPFFPDDIICILAGLTDIPVRRFVIIICLSRPWGLLAASALGGSAFAIPTGMIPVVALALAALFYLGLKYGDRVEAAVLKHFNK